MNKLYKQFTYILSLTTLFLAVGCSDNIDDEITSLDVSRLFSPVELSTQITNKTGVKLTWTAVNKAQSYNIQVFDNGTQDFSGTPVMLITGVTMDQVPYTITGLDGETSYSVRVQAIGTDIAESKWTGATFKTDTEQIFYAINLEEITATSAILRWPAGQTATKIILTPGNIEHTVTATDIAAGTATITGLTGEILYTAKLMNGTKTRGEVTFTTPLDLGGAFAINPGDDLAAIIDAANEGDVFALMPGEYTISLLNISKTISIKGAKPADKPIIKTVIFHIKTGAGLLLRDLILDGTGSDGNQAITYDDDLKTGEYDALSVENCVISGYTKGLMYVNKACNIKSVLFKNNVFTTIECSGGDFIDFRTGIAQTFEFTNNTVYNSALERDFFRMDSAGSTNFPSVTSSINISNNTFNKVSTGEVRRMLYIRLAIHEITFNKNIIANGNGYYSNQTAIVIKEMKDNNYFNAPNYVSSTQANAKKDTGVYTTLDPGFRGADNGDFTLSNEDLKSKKIGDSRWY